MIVHGFREEDATIEERAEPPRELRVPALEVVGAELIDREKEDELGPQAWYDGRDRLSYRRRSGATAALGACRDGGEHEQRGE
jgi:hypothetical protein